MTDKFCYKRIAQQGQYMVKIMLSDRTQERKLELYESAVSQLFRYTKNKMPLLFFAASTIIQVHIQIAQALRPKPKFAPGGVCAVSEKGREIINQAPPKAARP